MNGRVDSAEADLVKGDKPKRRDFIEDLVSRVEDALEMEPRPTLTREGSSTAKAASQGKRSRAEPTLWERHRAVSNRFRGGFG